MSRKPAGHGNPPMAKVLEEFTVEDDPWRILRNKPGIRIISTARRGPEV